MQFNAIQAIHVNPGSPWCIRPYICLLALCQLDAWMEGWTDIANGWIRASTIIGTLIQCTVKCPLLLFAGGSVAGKGTGPNLQHLVAISPRSLTALVRRSKNTTSRYKDQQHEKQHKQNPPYCHNLSHPSSTTPSHMIKPKKMKVLYHVNRHMTHLHHCTHPFPPRSHPTFLHSDIPPATSC